MNSVTILPIPTGRGGITYWAVSNGKRSEGATAGQALDALTAQITDRNAGTLVIIQNRQPDPFFTAEQQSRLAELLAKWRSGRDDGKRLPADEDAELDALIDAELRGAAPRAAAYVDALTR